MKHFDFGQFLVEHQVTK